MARELPTRVGRFVRDTPALALLLSLVALLMAAPLIGPVDVRGRSGLAELCLGTLFVMMLLAATLVAAQRRHTRIVAWVMFAVLFVLWLAELLTGPSGPVTVARHAAGGAYVSFVVVIILATVFSARHVSVDTIAAALCVYLLMAIIWAEVYSLMEMANPGSFHVNTMTDPDVPLQIGGQGTALALYYSLVTMTTLGFGDVVPKTPPARMFSAMEAVIGQMYLAVLVARLVGMHIADTTRSPADNEPSDP